MTHRSVANKAGVSLAATTYYYATKNDIIADASRELLDGYVAAFHRFADKHRGNANRPTFRDFAFKLVLNAMDKHSVASVAWCEIIANISRQPELGHLARDWFSALHEVWQEIAGVLGADDAEGAVTSAIDTVIGFLFILLPLRLTESEAHSLLFGAGGDPAPHFPAPPPVSPAKGKKAAETRERILAAATDILIDEGAEALSFRRVAERAGLTPAAPTYYYPSISTLSNAAQQRLFENSKTRYRSVMSAIDYARLDLDQLVDVTTTIFLREATEFRDLSRASYPVYIQSRRDPVLRAGLWGLDEEQRRRWLQVLATVMPGSSPLYAWIMPALFIGKLIRILSMGGDMELLAKVRTEFAYDLGAMAKDQHWSSSKQK